MEYSKYKRYKINKSAIPFEEQHSAFSLTCFNPNIFESLRESPSQITLQQVEKRVEMMKPYHLIGKKEKFIELLRKGRGQSNSRKEIIQKILRSGKSILTKDEEGRKKGLHDMVMEPKECEKKVTSQYEPKSNKENRVSFNRNHRKTRINKRLDELLKEKSVTLHSTWECSLRQGPSCWERGESKEGKRLSKQTVKQSFRIPKSYKDSFQLSFENKRIISKIKQVTHN